MTAKDQNLKSHVRRVQEVQKNPDAENIMDRVIRIKYYTDPLCCWSWAFQKNWNQLRDDRGQYFHFEYVMCGMLPSWKNFSDPFNSVTNPMQMGPVWMHAAQVAHTPIDYSIWHVDPPTSSYPACIAIKCAGLQSQAASDLYLKKVREAVMMKCMNIARQEVLLSIAHELHQEAPAIFNYDRFVNDLKLGNGREPFRKDIEQAAFYSIGRYPTLTITNASASGIILTGFRPYQQLLEVFDSFLDTTLEASIKLNNKMAI
jgi:putative protein-disulfide isomerase